MRVAAVLQGRLFTERVLHCRLLGELASERSTLALLQTVPGVNLIGAAMRLVEIGSDMSVFGTPER
ncbi:MAG TPA: hypothetical protein PKJ92_16165, partial [Accumulibacter sp.]|nr:hypothetical protein [Accumulibacter sp.]